MHEVNKLFKALNENAAECFDQGRYDEATAYYENVIELEQSTQNRFPLLASLHLLKACCHSFLLE